MASRRALVVEDDAAILDWLLDSLGQRDNVQAGLSEPFPTLQELSPPRAFRAFEEASSPDDLAAMVHELRDALHAGAIGLSTSRSTNHLTPDGHPVASRLAEFQSRITSRA